MPLRDVRTWAARFDADFGDTDRGIDLIAPRVRVRGHFLRDEFLETYAWKTTRTLGKARQYTEAEIADVTGLAFRQTNERLRYNLLCAMDGVEAAVASTLLYVGVSDD